MAREQEQFLEVVDRDEAHKRFRAAFPPGPRGTESVPLDQALDRVLARDVVSPTDVPSFDRSNVDGFAVQACDTYGASEASPRLLSLRDQPIVPGAGSPGAIATGEAASIATGAPLPRGADAIVMVEYAEVAPQGVRIARPVSPGDGVTFAGTDISAGELVVRAGELLTSRETGVLAAIGVAAVDVIRRPRVAILSTGNELVEPGESMHPGLVYDSNARILADAVREQGGVPVPLGIVADDAALLRARVLQALDDADLVLLSGGTSKGEGDLSYRVVREFTDPGIVAHGVALKPGKPLCLAATRGKPVVVLPGFPTSAVFTFHEFVAPLIREFAGLPVATRATVTARLPLPVRSEMGRTEYLLVGLVGGDHGLTAFPMGKGSGSVTTFSRADGFVTIDRHQEMISEGSTVDVQLLAAELRLPDFVVIGSQCIGLDEVLAILHRRGVSSKFLAVGSTAGLRAAQRGECDLAGIHLLDPATQVYNSPFLTPELVLLPGYRRMQGVAFRRGDARFEGATPQEAAARAAADPACVMVNRNQGSGTRILIDQLLAGKQPPGYAVQPRNHHAVARAIAQGRADWGVTIEWVARASELGFMPLREEHFDFVALRSRLGRPGLEAFLAVLAEPATRQRLARMGFKLP